MKLFRHGDPGQERPGVLDATGHRRDLSGQIEDINPATVGPEALARIRALDFTKLPLVDDAARVGPCIAGVSNLVGIGLNYANHAAEAHLEIPKYPLAFNKAPSCIAGPDDALRLAPNARELDYEIELAVVLGREAWQVDAAHALEYVAGYCLSNDFTDRYWQSQYAGQWTIGKSGPGFDPLGPWLVTPDEVGDPADIWLDLRVNGVTRQHSNTSGMIFKVPELIAYLSQFFILRPGDVITTGTPAGVGLATGIYLTAGDEIHADGGVLGVQRIRIEDASGAG